MNYKPIKINAEGGFVGYMLFYQCTFGEAGKN